MFALPKIFFNLCNIFFSMGEEKFFWAEEVAKILLKQNRKVFVCEGMWTPSGHFHIGNCRPEVFVPFAVKRELEKNGVKTKQNLVLDDFDPLDKIPEGLGLEKGEWQEHIGKPLYFVPSPFGSFKSWAEAFSSEVKSVLPEFGVKINIFSVFEKYREGAFNDLIVFSLNNAREIVSVWNRIAGTEKPLSFLPLQVICKSCGKTLYTEVLAWNGKKVKYKCIACGNGGENAPFNGKAKLHWRVHWCANWIINNVAFESGGKDHFSKGGSVDVGQALMKEVFKKPAPYQIPTEFIQLKGKKLAGSTGVVITPREWLSVASPELLRFLIFSYRPEKAIDFSFEDNSFILLNERFERAERIFYKKEKAENASIGKKIKKAFDLSLIEKPAKVQLQIPFSHLALIAQLVVPEKEVEKAITMMKETGHVKAKLSQKEKEKIKRQLVRTIHWIEKYASEQFKISFLEKLDESVLKEIPQDVRNSFSSLAEKLSSLRKAEEIQTAIFDFSKKQNLGSKELFKGLYLILIGKGFGPKIGSLVLALGKDRCIERMKQAA